MSDDSPLVMTMYVVYRNDIRKMALHAFQVLRRLVSGVSLHERGYFTMKRFVAPCALAIGMALSVTACSNPYDPGQRAVGGGLI
ncbi:MAG: hypothetical protein P4L90_04815, partial [Rhodopila sp.]|nr:hypothetical protein [Rhodopila sp.]